MDRPWVWREYDEEGLRFSLLMAQHELRDLAVRLAAMRPAPSQAQRILGQYHHAYRDLTGALAGVRDDDLDRVPRDGEWPVREVILHMLGAESGFLGTVQYARPGSAGGRGRSRRPLARVARGARIRGA